MRKKKWADPYLESHADYALVEPKDYSGKWKGLFNVNKLHVEIGTGKGDYINGMSQLYPDEGWVGIEREHNVAAVACRKVLDSDEPDTHNKRMIIGNAELMSEWFAPGEIDFIHLNFSDPWPKKHSHFRRLSSEAFLEMYKTLLAEDGKILMKTDNKALFEDSVLYFIHNGFMLSEISVDYRRIQHDEDVITEYEDRFMKLGQPIYHLTAYYAGNV